LNKPQIHKNEGNGDKKMIKKVAMSPMIIKGGGIVL